MKTTRFLPAFFLVLAFAGCSSVGTLGIVTKSMGDAGQLLKSGRPYRELGPVEGETCRYFLLALIPWGDSSFSTAVNQALAERGADALINVTVTSSLYGFIPIYNVFGFTCTSVQGIAVKFEQSSPSSLSSPSSPSGPPSPSSPSGPPSPSGP